MKQLGIGDIVLNPLNPGGLVCVIIDISGQGKRKSFTLAPMTKSGWPTVNQQIWQVWNIAKLTRMKQARKYPHLYVCPTCNNPNEILVSPLRRQSIYKDEFQCKKCKKVYTEKEGVRA